MYRVFFFYHVDVWKWGGNRLFNGNSTIVTSEVDLCYQWMPWVKRKNRKNHESYCSMVNVKRSDMRHMRHNFITIQLWFLPQVFSDEIHGHVRQDQHLLPCGVASRSQSPAPYLLWWFHVYFTGWHGDFMGISTGKIFEGMFWVTHPGTPVNNITKVSVWFSWEARSC